MLRLKEKLIVLISVQLFLVLRINLSSHLSLVFEQLSVLFLPTLKFFHLLLVMIFFFDDSTLLLLLSSPKCFSLFSQLSFSQLVLIVIRHDFVPLILSMLADSLFLKSIHLAVVLLHHRWKLLVHLVQLLVVDDEKHVGKHCVQSAAQEVSWDPLQPSK